ncbi:ComEA family DNA-binding protein [Congregibacter sp.]|uniref:ComEA family DNA-binding protein n=1 Tax=Congregibacter sp. TaxID=2744308 RepID=UPI003F6CCD0D
MKELNTRRLTFSAVAHQMARQVDQSAGAAWAGNGQGPFKRCPARNRSLPLLAVAAFAAQLCVPAAPALAQGEAVNVAQTTAVEQKLEQEGAGVNINNASAVELAEGLNGVGGSKAEAIVRYREQFGPFESIEELSEVTGIGAATVERNRLLLRIR